MVIGTWILSFSIMIPTWRGVWGKFGLDIGIGSCSILHDSNDRSPKEFLFVLAFMVPCLCIVFCYARIFYLVRKAAFRTREPASKAATATSRINEPKPTVATSNQEHNKNNVGPIVDGDVSPKPFGIDEDIEFIDVNCSLENLPISYKSSCTPTAKDPYSNSLNVSMHDVYVTSQLFAKSL